MSTHRLDSLTGHLTETRVVQIGLALTLTFSSLRKGVLKIVVKFVIVTRISERKGSIILAVACSL